MKMRKQKKGQKVTLNGLKRLKTEYIEKQNERIAELEEGLQQVEAQLLELQERLLEQTIITLALAQHLPRKTDEVPF